MQPHTDVIKFPTPDSIDDGTRLIAWCYDRGEITIMVEGLSEDADGETLLTFTPEVGVEIGNSTVLALSGEPSMLLFKGEFPEQRDAIFNAWNKLAEENERPAIFDDEGLPGLTRLPNLPEPPLPEIDEERTAHANEVLRVSRELIAEAGKTRNLTLDDCYDVLAAVEAAAAEREGTDGRPKAASCRMQRCSSLRDDE